MNGNARVAGLLYLITVVTGMFYLGYVPSQLATHGDVAAKVARVLQMNTLFRLGIVAELACQAAFLLLPLALYRLLGGAGRTAAVLMVAFAVASVPVALANVGHRLDVLSLLGNADYRQVFDSRQLQGEVMLHLDAYRQGLLMLEVFWGAWLLPLGFLVGRCGLLPRLLGMFLILGGLGYLVDFLATLLLPSYAASALADYILLPASVGELGTCLWLLAGAPTRTPIAAVRHA